MKIGIDCRKFYDIVTNRGAGVERYSYHLIKTLLEIDKHNDYVLFFYSDISPETIYKVKGKNARVKIVKIQRKKSSIPILGNHLSFSLLLNKEKLDLTLFLTGSMPLFYKKPSIVVVHDLAIYLFPEWFPDKQWFSTKVIFPRSVKKAKKIITVSENTKKDLIKLFKVPEYKIIPIYPGVKVKGNYLPAEIEAVKKKYDIKKDFVLFLGTIEPRKNIINLIKAFSNYVFESEKELNLIIAGIRGWKYKKIFLELEDLNKRFTNSQIKYIGPVSNRERNILIGCCQVFVFPSQYEGFGFPVLEAMALDAPVVTGNNSSLKEICQDSALLVDTSEVNEIRKGIKQVLESPEERNELIAKGRQKVKQFTWEKTVYKLLEVIKKDQ